MNPSEDVDVTDVLRGLRKRAGLSMEALAIEAGYKGASSIQRYENPAQFHKKYLPYDLAEKLGAALEGKGIPPIQKAEVFALAGPIARAAFPLNNTDETTQKSPTEEQEVSPIQGSVGEIRDILIFDTGSEVDETDTFILLEDILGYARRPTCLTGAKDAYAFYVPVSTMEPKLPEGSLQVVHPNRRTRPGDDAVLQVNTSDSFEVVSYLIRIESISGEEITASTYKEPDTILAFDRGDIVRVGKLLSVEDMVG